MPIMKLFLFSFIPELRNVRLSEIDENVIDERLRWYIFRRDAEGIADVKWTPHGHHLKNEFNENEFIGKLFAEDRSSFNEGHFFWHQHRGRWTNVIINGLLMIRPFGIFFYPSQSWPRQHGKTSHRTQSVHETHQWLIIAFQNYSKLQRRQWRCKCSAGSSSFHRFLLRKHVFLLLINSLQGKDTDIALCNGSDRSKSELKLQIGNDIVITVD